MSYDATNWAIKQKGLKPATKLVLWYLCDRHNPDFGCFPRQDRLAADAELSVSSLNDHLRTLEERGLIRRIKRSDPKTKQQLSTLYILGFEERFTQEPTPKTGTGFDDDQGPGSVDNCGDNGGADSEKPTPNLDENPVPNFGGYRESVRRITSKEEDAGASASANPQPFVVTHAGFDALLRLAGHDPNGELPSWWQGQAAVDHVTRWNKDYGFDEARILAIAKAARAGHTEALQGPKGLDAAMKKAAKNGTGSPPAPAPGTPEATDQICAFYAERINANLWVHDSLSNDIKRGMVARKLVTVERLRERGLL